MVVWKTRISFLLMFETGIGAPVLSFHFSEADSHNFEVFLHILAKHEVEYKNDKNLVARSTLFLTFYQIKKRWRL